MAATKPLDVLAVMDAELAALVAIADDFGNAAEDEEHAELIESAREARAAVAELIKALRQIEALPLASLAKRAAAGSTAVAIARDALARVQP